MRTRFMMILGFILLYSCRPNSKESLPYSYVLEGDRKIFFENFAYDSSIVFPDTVIGKHLQACSDSFQIKYLIPVDTLNSMGLYLFKTKTLFSPTQPEISYLIGVQNTGRIKLYHAIDTNLLNQYLSCEAAFGTPFIDRRKDTFLVLNFEISENGWSPYFSSSVTFRGIKWWNKNDVSAVFGLYPISEVFDFRDIIKGDYDEEVGGSPVIGTIDEHREWSYRILFDTDVVRLRLTKDEFYLDVDTFGIVIDDEEPRKSIYEISDTAEIVYRRISLPSQTLRK